MPTWLTAALTFLANITGMAKARSDRKNAPDVRDRAKAQQQVTGNEAIAKAIADRDDEALRRMGEE